MTNKNFPHKNSQTAYFNFTLPQHHQKQTLGNQLYFILYVTQHNLDGFSLLTKAGETGGTWLPRLRKLFFICSRRLTRIPVETLQDDVSTPATLSHEYLTKLTIEGCPTYYRRLLNLL